MAFLGAEFRLETYEQPLSATPPCVPVCQQLKESSSSNAVTEGHTVVAASHRSPENREAKNQKCGL
jgi:hypothetical protein